MPTQRVHQAPKLFCVVRVHGVVLTGMGSTILVIASTILGLQKMAILILFPSHVPCQGNMLLEPHHLPILLLRAVAQITRMLPVCAVASRVMLKTTELDDAVVRLRKMSWADRGGLDMKAWSI
jgi:hypothetical protein